MGSDKISERPTEAVAALFLDDSDPALVPEPKVSAGTQIGGYRIDEQIGMGATGIVYSATHPMIGKRVAIKVLRQDLCDDPTSIERFVLEARSVNAIGHANIVDIFDLGALPDGRQFMVMDLLIGRTLRRALDAGPLPLGEAAAILGDIGSALAAAHDKGFIHRDLKPDNVFLVDVPDRRADVRLLDFGLVKLVAGAHPEGAGVRTRTGIVIGTPAYMSPEQARAKNVDHRTDIYALGVMTFELLSGRRPYEHKNVLDLLILHAEAPIPSLRERIPQIPVEVAQLVEAMLEKQPDDRPTLAAVRAVLERIPRTVSAVVRAQLAPAMPINSGPVTALERPLAGKGEKPTLPLRRSQPRIDAASAAVAMTAMPAYKTAAVAGAVPPAASAPLPKAVPKGTPSKTEQVPGITAEVAATTSAIVSEEVLGPPPTSKKLWLLFAIAAVLAAGGGLLLGMSL